MIERINAFSRRMIKLCLLIGLIGLNTLTAQTVEEYLQKAEKAYRLDDKMGLLKYSIKALEIDSTNRKGLIYRIQAYSFLNRDSIAMRYVDEFIAMNTNRVEGYIEKVYILESKKRKEEARDVFKTCGNKEFNGVPEFLYVKGLVHYSSFEQKKLYEKALTLIRKKRNQSTVDNLYLAIRIARKLKKYKEVKTYYNLLSAKDSTHVRALKVLVYCAQDQKALEEEKAYSEQILRHNPKHVYALVSLANIKMRASADSVAIGLWSRAILIDPHSNYLRYRKAVAYSNLKEYQKAVDVLESAIKKDSTYKHNYYELGLNYHFLHQFQEAKKAYSKVIEMDSTYYEAYYNRAKIKSLEKQDLSALDDLNYIIDHAKGGHWLIWAYELRYSTFISLREYEAAYLDADDLVKLKPKNPTYYYKRGLVALRSRLYYLAEEDFKKAIKLDAGYTDAYLKLGNLASLRFQDKKAIKYYNQVLEFDEKHREAYLYRGNAYARLRKNKEARQDWKIAKSLEKKKENENL